MLTSSIKNIIFLPPGGPNKVFLLASKLPSNASYKFLVVVLPEKLTKAKTMFSGVLNKKSLTTTDLPTPVSPVTNTLNPLNIRVYRIDLYLTVSVVGTRISKNFFCGSKSKDGT
jgi:hypothetical protein